MKWTTKQEECLRAHSHEGVFAATMALYQELGVSRNVNAVKVHAHRMGLSMALRYVCPKCGHVGPPRDFRFGDGLCEACHVDRTADELDRRNEILDREYQQKVKEAYRKHAKMRQRNARKKRRNGNL